MKNKPFNIYPKLVDLYNDIEKHFIECDHSGKVFVTPEMFKLEDEKHWDNAIQKSIDYCAEQGGGQVFFSSKEYKIVNTIYVKENVILYGVSQGSAIIQLDCDADCDIVNFSNNKNCGMHDMSIKGNRYYTQYGSISSEDKYAVVVGKDGADSAENNSQMDNFTFYNVEITNMSGSGIYFKPYSWVYSVHDITVRNCTKYGIIISGSDNLFSNLYVDNCGFTGVMLLSCNNRITNAKIIFCGSKMDSNRKNRCGLYMERGDRCQLTSIECQENFGDGFYFNNCTTCIFSNLLSDANGYAKRKGVSTENGYGFYLSSVYFSHGTLSATSYSKGENPQYVGLLINETCSSNYFNLNGRDNTSLYEDNSSDEMKNSIFTPSKMKSLLKLLDS